MGSVGGGVVGGCGQDGVGLSENRVGWHGLGWG